MRWLGIGMVGSWISVIPFLQGIISFVGLSAVLEYLGRKG